METGSMGIWEAGPTAIVYSPASRETRCDRLRFWVFCQGQLGGAWCRLVLNGVSLDHLKVSPTVIPQPPVYLPDQHLVPAPCCMEYGPMESNRVYESRIWTRSNHLQC
jgi:hypothetical protein